MDLGDLLYGDKMHKYVKGVDETTFAPVLMAPVGALTVSACVAQRTGNMGCEAVLKEEGRLWPGKGLAVGGEMS